MEIAILIGNGFDLNLGLNTTYKHFIHEYIEKINTSENIKKFKKNIKKDLDSWADAEIKFGKYTSNYIVGEKENFMECHDDFINELADYLSIECQKLDITNEICRAFGNDFQNIFEALNAEEHENIKEIFDKHIASTYAYNFLVFNYTSFIKEFSKSTAIKYNQHRHASITYTNKISEIRHIHGTVLKEMSLGLNDIGQIENLDLFESDNNDIGQLVKPLNNKAFGEFNDKYGYELLKRSSIYYVYGMSLGETDKLWWERIGTFLSEDAGKRLILHNFSENKNPRLSRHIARSKETCKKKFMAFQKDEVAKKINLDNQIIVTDGNLFKHLKNVAANIKNNTQKSSID